MTEVAPKTYISMQPTFTANFYDDDGKRKIVRFANGKFTTSDKDLQDHVEGLDGFGKFISVGPNAPSPLELKASALRAEADLADQAADDAEAAVKAFLDKPKQLRALADAADTVAKAAEDAVAKAAAPAPVPATAPVPAAAA